MEYILLFIKNNWSSLVINIFLPSGIIFAFIKLYINKTIESRVSLHYQKQIDEFKFDLERKKISFNLYLEKKHNSYPEIFQKMVEADSKVKGIMGMQHYPDLSKYSEYDLKIFLESIEFQKSAKDNILDIFKTDFRHAQTELTKILRIVRYYDAKNSIHELNNSFWYNQLYFPNELVDILEKYKTSLLKLYYNYELVSPLYNITDRDERIRLNNENEELLSQINILFKEIESLIKKEMSIGYYS
jgi:hypothetical protein